INIFSGEGVGTTALSFLKLEGSAKIAGLGGVVCGISDDVSSIFGNPAGLGLVNNKEISLMYGMLYEGIVYNNIGYVHPIREVGSFGVGLRYISYGEIEGLDEYGNPTSNFTPTDLAIIISYAKELNGFNLGGSIKYISSKIRKTAQAVGLDLGVMKNGLLDNKLSVGLVIQNLGTKIKYNTEEESLPMNIKIGCGYKVIDNLLCGLDISLPNDNDVVISLGGEYKYKVSDDIEAKVRLGFTTLTKDVEGSLKGISIGLGGGYKTFGIDYAFVPYGELGQTHRISLVVKF
ncbi:MAG: PorV/PorQ family protein, partial [Endomicrobia bacterium]|nr:PorV/PorQ family protein [Endomicrobiia bacterium]